MVCQIWLAIDFFVLSLRVTNTTTDLETILLLGSLLSHPEVIKPFCSIFLCPVSLLNGLCLQATHQLLQGFALQKNYNFD